MVVGIAGCGYKGCSASGQGGRPGGEVTGQRGGRERDKSRVRASVEGATERQRVAANASGRRGNTGARARR